MAKTLDYDFTDPQFDGTNGIDAQTGPTLTVARAGASRSSVMDYFNVLKIAGVNEPRFTGGRRVENLCLQSEDFSTTWTNTGTTEEVNETTDPDGGATADRIVATVSSGEHRMTQLALTGVKDTNYTSSVYIKDDGARYVWLQLYEAHALEFAFTVLFDLSLGTVVDSDVGTWGTLVDSGIEDAGNGWHRCWSTGSIAYSGNYYIIIGSSDSASPSWGANQRPAAFIPTAGDDWFLWGAQIEDVSGQDDPAPSEYIATTTAAKAQWYATKRRTNLCLQSQDLSTTWINIASSDTQSIAGAPDGTATMNRITDNGTNNQHSVYQQISLAPSASHTYSAYVKAETISDVSLTLSDGSTNWFAIVADLDAVSISSTSTGGDGAIVSSGIELATVTYPSAPADVYRIWVEGTSDEAIYIYLGLSNSPTPSYDTGGRPKYTGDSSGTALFWGAQYEQGDTATAYIATTDAVASSSVDTAITPTGLLIEEERTNLCTYSEDLGTSWLTLKADITETNSATAPDGTATADKLKDDSSGGDQSVTAYKSVTTVTSTTYVFSTYAKADGVSWLNLYISANASEVIHAYYDLTNGVVGATLGADNVDQGIEDAGGGWFRCWIKYTAADTQQQPAMRLADSDNDHSVDCTSGASSLFLWGHQLEAGAFPTSYIPTVASSVTRNADIVSSSDVSWYTADVGSFYIEASQIDIATAAARYGYFSLDNGVSNRTIEAYFTDSAGNDGLSAYGTATMGEMNPSSSTITSKDTLYKHAIGFAIDDAAIYTEGALSATDTSITSFATPANFYVGSRYAGNAEQLNGHISRIIYYNERLTDEQLEDLSNGIFPASGERRVALLRSLLAELNRGLARNLLN